MCRRIPSSVSAVRQPGKVSIVTPCLNGAAFLRRRSRASWLKRTAISSISWSTVVRPTTQRRSLPQPTREYGLYRFRAHPGSCDQCGFRAYVRGFFAFLNADDILEPEAVAEGVRAARTVQGAICLRRRHVCRRRWQRDSRVPGVGCNTRSARAGMLCLSARYADSRRGIRASRPNRRTL